VLSFDPPNGATCISVETTELTIVFDELMMGGVGFSNSGVEALKAEGFGYPEMDFARWDESGKVLTIPIEALEPGIEYVLPIGRPLKDLSGNQTEAIEYHFTTSTLTGET
jgi:hypothetical protein